MLRNRQRTPRNDITLMQATSSPVLTPQEKAVPSTPIEVSYSSLIWRRLRRDRVAMFGAVLVGILIIVALFAPLLAPHDPSEQFRDGLTADGQPVSSTLFNKSGTNFPLGTDANGRDLLSRIIYGSRVSLLVGVMANLLAVLLGLVIGMLAGYLGGWVETVLMRFTDIMMAFPTLLLAMTLVAILKPSLWIIIVVIGLVYWTWIARVVYSQVLAMREREFVIASRALGGNRRFVILHHILPQLIPTI